MLSIKYRLTQLYYVLTCYLPRKIPATPAEYEKFKAVLVSFYGLPDDPPTWIAVSGQLVSTHGHKLRVAWGNVANAAKRLAINNLAMGHKREAMQILNDRLKDAVERECARQKEQDEQAKAAGLPQTDGSQEQAPSTPDKTIDSVDSTTAGLD